MSTPWDVTTRAPARSLPVPGPRAALGLAACAGFAAAVLPGARAGVGLALALCAVAATAAVLRGTRPSGVELAFAAAAVALAAQAVLRDHPLLVALDALGAGWAAAVALGGERRWLPLARAGLAPLRRPLHGLAFTATTLRGLLPERRGRALGPVLRGSAISVALLGVFGALFASADGAFAQLAGDAFAPELDTADLLLRATLALAALALAGSLAVATLPAPAGPGAPGRLTRRGLERAEWLMPLAALGALFAVFVAVQLAVLFGGRRHVLETAGLGYGEYARQGFGQLLCVAALTLAVVAAGVRLARPTGPRDAWLLRGLLGALCALCAVVLASALHRLGLVVDAYGATRVRLGGQAVALWLGALLALVATAGLARPVARELPRLAVALTLAVLLAHSLSAPDARIAEANVARFERTGDLDASYAASLSADAVPALTRLPARERGCALVEQRFRLAVGDGWAGANRARSRARAALAQVPLSPCSGR